MFILHIDMNFAAFRLETLRNLLNTAAAVGFDTILWEIEDKVRLDSLGCAVHPDALSKDEFRDLLHCADCLGLKSIPLLQTLGHAEYVLKEKSFFPLREADSPDCYCTSNPQTLDFLKRMIAEIAELFGRPEYFHLGGDEAYNYATCPECSAKDKNEMFIRHETELASLLAQRGIRPCIWADMLRHHPEIRDSFDRKFVIWLWNYSYTDEWMDEENLRTAGYDLVICPASSSSGDSPFLPQWGKHAGNIAGAARIARLNHALGICITSWSIRMGLKITQLPLWELGSKIYLDRLDFRQAESTVRNKYFGEADPDILGEWPWHLTLLSGVQWTRYKDGSMPPAGHFAARIAAEKDAFRELGEKIPVMIEKSRTSQAKIPQDPAVMQNFRSGSKIRLEYLELIGELLAGRPCSIPELKSCRAAFASYLAQEQTPASAEHNANLIYNPMIEYAEAQQS